MGPLFAHSVFVAFGLTLGACFVLFRVEPKNSPSSPSLATRWRFNIAACGCCLFLLLAPGRPLVFGGGLLESLQQIAAVGFLVWPIFALWLMAAPITYRTKSAYLLSFICLLSTIWWYLFLRSTDFL